MIIDDLIQSKIIKFDSGLEIEINRELYWFDQLEYLKIQDEIEKGRFLVQKIIKSWNLKDKEGNILPISKENINKLSAEVAIAICMEVKNISKENNSKKKDSNKK